MGEELGIPHNTVAEMGILRMEVRMCVYLDRNNLVEVTR